MKRVTRKDSVKFSDVKVTAHFENEIVGTLRTRFVEKSFVKRKFGIQ